MDPTTALNNIRELANMITSDYEDPGSIGVDQDDAANLAEMMVNLDEWLNKGGFLPQDWLKASDENLFTAIDRILAANESLCCDDEDDRKKLALALCMGLQKRD